MALENKPYRRWNCVKRTPRPGEIGAGNQLRLLLRNAQTVMSLLHVANLPML